MKSGEMLLFPALEGVPFYQALKQRRSLYRKLGVRRVQLHGVWKAAQSKLGRLIPRGRIQSLSSVTSGVLRAKRLIQTRT